MKFQVLFFLVLFSFLGYAQEGTVTITSKKNLPLYVLVNDVLQNEVAEDTLHITLKEGSVNFKVISPDSLRFTEQNIFVQRNKNIQYEFSIENSAADIKIIGEYLFETKQQNNIDYKPQSNNHIKEVLLQKINNIEFVNKLFSYNSYSGKKGCDNPDYINKYELIRKIEDYPFTNIKVDIIIRELSGKCIKVDDIKDLIVLIDYEDIRLDCLMQLKPFVYDIDNLQLLSTLFKLKQSQETFQELKNNE